MKLNYDLGVDDPEAFAGRIKRFNVADLIRKSSRMYANRVAVAEPGREVTYAELNARVNRLSNAPCSSGGSNPRTAQWRSSRRIAARPSR